MAGRKCVIEPSLVIDAVIFFKESVILTDENGEKSKLRKIITFLIRIIKLLLLLTVWSDISSKLDNRMSASAIHTFVYKGRHRIKEQLGFLPPTTFPVSANIIDENQLSNGSGT
ncbi:unnamed protein product [Macrosiphum euphorbiae]|uniref:Uncharacterized protein n=1 Tax=Macrosiphum euphorbiae TaxID=13131 RepID=A0AAV0YAT5_9HEMI|nr:unnamed protein product [Macrosiphum euphorbiae]